MLRHETQTRPGLVALYDIRPGNGVDLFLQPRSLQELTTTDVTDTSCVGDWVNSF